MRRPRTTEDGGRGASPAALLLASASPRRARILREAGIPFTVAHPAVEEVVLADAERTARANARAKADWAAVRHPGAAIVAADTVVSFGDAILGKPPTLRAARAMLAQLAGREHVVLTAVALVRPGHAPRVVCRRSRVRFRPLTAEAIDAYVRAVDPRDKAGGYDIGERGELLVAGCRGSRTNVMGLPIEEVLPWWNRLRARASPR